MTTRIGAIGLGGLGKRELEIYDGFDDVEIVAGADVASGAREQFEASFAVPTYESYEELLDAHAADLDAVSIVTPHTLHYEQTKAVLEAGLHVFVEKPFVTDVDHAVELVELADERDLVLQVGYQRHFHPAYRRIKRLIDDGEIGQIHMVNCFLGQHWIDRFHDTWRANPDLSGGGQLYDSGSHLLDTLLWTTGTTPRNVAALVDRRDHEADVNSSLSVALDRDGRRVTATVGITGDGTSTSGTEEGLFIWGTDGRIAFDGTDLRVIGKGEGDRNTSRTINVETDLTFRALAERKLQSFISAVSKGAESPVPGEYGLQVTALTEAAYRASERGSTVDVGELLAAARSVAPTAE